MDDKLRKEGKEQDDSVATAKSDAKNKLNQAMRDKEHLLRQIKEAGDD